MTNESSDQEYALKVANDSYRWYQRAAIRSRRLARTSELAIIALSAAIPLTVAVFPELPLVPAALGAAITLASGARATFHWNENYLRFSRAREAIESERRKYRTGAEPYEDRAVRGQVLVLEITRIEQDEMGQWLQLAKPSNAGEGT